VPHYRNQEDVAEAMEKLAFGEEMEMDKEIEKPEDGVLVHGLFTDGFRWSDEENAVEDSLPGIMNSVVPMMHMEPKIDYEVDPLHYNSPLYKTSARAGVLSTTGHYGLLMQLFYISPN
jgi:dynein heavy chain